MISACEKVMWACEKMISASNILVISARENMKSITASDIGQ